MPETYKDGNSPRVLARQTARELAPAEISEVSGGDCWFTPATCGTGGNTTPNPPNWDCDPPALDCS